MVVSDKSPSRIVSGASLERSGMFDDLSPLKQEPLHHSSSHGLVSLEGNFEAMDHAASDDEESQAVSLPPRSLPEIVFNLKSAKKAFGSNSFFNYPSCLTSESTEVVNLKRYCYFDQRYEYHLPREADRMWHTPKRGWQAIADLFFQFGFRAPLHPFFQVVFEVFGCGVGQFSPNSIAQIIGVIARCHKVKEVPTIELLMSIFRVKNVGGQLYLDKRAGRVRLVDVSGSHAGWHSKWVYLEGGDLNRVNPWNGISKSWLKRLNNDLGVISDEFLDFFHGKEELYSTGDLADEEFLIEHCLAGKTLRALKRSPPKMLSGALMAMMAKRATSSVVAPFAENVGEKGPEETSRMIDPSGYVGSGVAPEIVALDLEDGDGGSREKKRHRKDGEGSSKHHHKKNRDIPRPRTEDVLNSAAPPTSVVLRFTDSGVDSSKAGLVKSCKLHLDQLARDFGSLVTLVEKEEPETEFLKLRREVGDLKVQRKDLEIRLAGVHEKKRQAVETIGGLENQVTQLIVDKEALNSLVASYQNIEAEQAAVVDQLKKGHEESIGRLKDEKLELQNELTSVREELCRSVEESFKILEKGYMLCFDRAAAAGYEMKEHTFEKCCQAVILPADGDGSSNRHAGGGS